MHQVSDLYRGGLPGKAFQLGLIFEIEANLVVWGKKFRSGHGSGDPHILEAHMLLAGLNAISIGPKAHQAFR